jgi:cobalt-zinc-cadmium efflux system membrane fusion protein
LPERNLRDAQRAFDSAQIAVDRARRTLVAWKLSDADLKALEAEAKALAANRDRPGPRPSDSKDWARVEVLAPQAGEILEKGVNLGDQVDTATDLYKIGDLANLEVWAHVFEEDLPLVQSLPKPIPCTIQVASRPSPLLGSIDRIGAVIDAAQHTALVRGKVLNPDHTLLINQYVTVTIELPNSKGDLEVPTAAVVEDGRESIVFVRSPDHPDQVVRRVVQVKYRTQQTITLKPGVAGVKAGEQVVATGALLLREVMETTPPPATATAE